MWNRFYLTTLRAPKVPFQQLFHGIEHHDPYAYMKQAHHQITRTYLRQEMDFAHSKLKIISNRSIIQRELNQILPSQSVHQSVKKNSFEYLETQDSTRTRYYRLKAGDGKSSRLVYFDTNWMKRFGFVQELRVSPHDSQFALIYCYPGSEQGTLFIYQMGKMSWSKLIEDVYRFVWVSETCIAFTRLNSQLRSSKVFLIHLSSGRVEEIYHERNLESFLDISMSKDGTHLFIHSHSSTSSETRAAKWTDDAGLTPLELIQVRNQGVHYFVDHVEGSFVLVEYSQLSCSVYKEKRLLKNFSLDETVFDIELFKNALVAFIRKSDGLPTIRCYDWSTGLLMSTVDLPEPICHLSSGKNPNYDTDKVRFTYSSFKTVFAECEYDFKKGHLEILTEKSVQLKLDDVNVERLELSGVPTTLYSSSDVAFQAQKRPLVVICYGAYGVPLEPGFRMEMIPLLKRGYVIALAHIKGGNEKGPKWHLEATKANKQNSFTDLANVARELKAMPFINPAHVTAIGHSAGGTAVAAVVNQYPGLFTTVILKSPFVDVLNTLLDPSQALTTVEREEWGDPLLNADAYSWIKAYSPYDNLSKSLFEKGIRILITAGDKDERVPLYQLLKYMAKCREVCPQSSSSEMILSVFEDRGHQASTHQDQIQEASLEVAYILKGQH